MAAYPDAHRSPDPAGGGDPQSAGEANRAANVSLTVGNPGDARCAKGIAGGAGTEKNDTLIPGISGHEN